MVTITAGSLSPLNLRPGQSPIALGGVLPTSVVYAAGHIYETTSLGYRLDLSGTFTYSTTTGGAFENLPSVKLTGGTLTGISISSATGQQILSIGDFSYYPVTKFTLSDIPNILYPAASDATPWLQVTGSSKADTIVGGTTDDYFVGGGGNDTIDGGGGNDTVIFSGQKSDYQISFSAAGTATIIDLRAGSPDGIETLKNIQSVRFSDYWLPLVNLPVSTPVAVANFQTVAASSLFYTENWFELPTTKYQLTDTTKDSKSGYFVVNGIAQAQGAVITATSLNGISFVSGSGSDAISVRVQNSYGWSAPTTTTVTAPIAHQPNVTALQSAGIPLPGQALPRPGTIVQLSDLFSASSPDGFAITEYRIYDSTPGAGTLLRNGVSQGNNVITIDPSALGSLTFKLNSAYDVLYVSAYDGHNWGAKTQITAEGFNFAPVVTALQSSITVGHLQSLGFSDLFTASDPQNSDILKYDFLDVSGGALVLDGMAQAAGTDVIVTAAQLSDLKFVASGSDKLSVRVWDGYSWSTRTQVAITAPVDNAPVVVVSALATPRLGTTVTIGSLISATDADGDATTEYRIYDATPGGGTLKLNNVSQGNNSVYLAPGDLGDLTFIAGTSDTLEIRAFDGSTWSAWKAVTVTSKNLAPTVTAANSTIVATQLQSFGFSELFSTGDPQGSNIVKYDFYDGTVGDGAIEVNGVVQAAQTDIVVNASALSSLSFVVSGTDTLYARVWDGYSWSARVKVTISAPTDWAPGIALPYLLPTDPTYQSGGFIANSNWTRIYNYATTVNTVTAVGKLFVVSDFENNSPTFYRFQDLTLGKGKLELNGVDQGTSMFTVAGSDLSSVTFVAGSGQDTFLVSANDGLKWSAWTGIGITGTAPAASPAAIPTLPTLATPVASSLAAATPTSSTVESLNKTNWGFASAS